MGICPNCWKPVTYGDIDSDKHVKVVAGGMEGADLCSQECVQEYEAEKNDSNQN